MDIRDLFFNQRKMRAGWRLVLFIATFMVLSYLLLSILLGLLGLGKTAVENQTGLQALLLSSYSLLPLLIATWFMTRVVEGRPFVSVGLSFKTSSLRELLWGVFIGGGIISVFFLIGFVVSLFEVSGLFATSQFGKDLPIYFIAILLAAASEEFLFRGYPFQTLSEGIGIYPTLFLTAFIFGSFHRLNPHVTTLGLVNDGLAGILLGLAYIKVKSLWLPFGIHFSWNFFQGIVYSFPVSGIEFEARLFEIEMGKPAYLTGGAFGPEGSIITTIMLCASIGALVMWKFLHPTSVMEELWNQNIYPAGRGDQD